MIAAPTIELLSQQASQIPLEPDNVRINIKLVFHISEDGSEIELKHCESSKISKCYW
jgi:hypothetical protein